MTHIIPRCVPGNGRLNNGNHRGAIEPLKPNDISIHIVLSMSLIVLNYSASFLWSRQTSVNGFGLR